MAHKISLLPAIGLFLLCGCSERTPGGEDQEAGSDNPASGYVEAVDKARDVEDQVLEAAEKQKRQIEAQEDG